MEGFRVGSCQQGAWANYGGGCRPSTPAVYSRLLYAIVCNVGRRLGSNWPTDLLPAFLFKQFIAFNIEGSLGWVWEHEKGHRRTYLQ